MIYNPFDLVVPTTHYKAETYSAETILNSPFGVPLKLIGESTKERDTSKLCGSKHFVETWVSLGASDEETATTVGAMSEDKKYVVPGQSNIIVGFSPQDTSGGGKVQKWFEDYILGPIIQGLGVAWDVTTPIRLVVGDFISNPVNWVSDKEVRRETAVNIIDAVPQDSKTGSTLSEIGCSVPGVNFVGYCRDGSDTGSKGLINRIWNWEWNAEEFKNETGTTTQLPDDTYWGTNYHNADAAAHKILVTITLERADGSIVQKHEKFITGSPEVYEENGNIYQKPGLGVFAIDEPGTWTVTMSPIAWGTCSNVDWSNTYTIDVPKPEWWDLETESAQEEEIETLTAQMNTKLEDLGLPTGLTVAAVAGIAITGVALLSYKFLNRS